MGRNFASIVRVQISPCADMRSCLVHVGVVHPGRCRIREGVRQEILGDSVSKFSILNIILSSLHYAASN